MTGPGRRRSNMSLREAASVVFGLAAVLPTLLFVYLLSSANLLHRPDVQIGLLSAVTVSVLGFLVFRRMIGQIARLAEQAPRLSEPAAAGVGADVAPVPGLGQVTEISQVTGAFHQMLDDNARLLEEARESARQLQRVVDDLKATQEQLVRGETLRAMGQLASGMAHHLNNLFAVILGRAELLLASAEGATARRSLENIRRAAQDGADVARRVQRFSRLHPLSAPVAVDLRELAADVVELARRRWQDAAPLAGWRFVVVEEPGPIPLAVGEVAPLREALMNLLLNAVDAMPDGGQATIRTWVEGDRVRCAVTDTGVGMSDEVRGRALEPFFTTKGPKSTGLGLSVTYGAVQRYGGALELDSAPGRGTTVTISLPIAPPPSAAEGSPESAAAPGARLKILVIDDEAHVRAALSGLLEGQGHTVVTAADGQEGLGRLKAGESFDLVLTDLGMPGMNGWDIARSIQQSWPRLPVGVITAWSEQAMTPEERSRVDLVVTKPFDAEQLRETLSALRARV